jgi:hypothetical protein
MLGVLSLADFIGEPLLGFVLGDFSKPKEDTLALVDFVDDP